MADGAGPFIRVDLGRAERVNGLLSNMGLSFKDATVVIGLEVVAFGHRPDRVVPERLPFRQDCTRTNGCGETGQQEQALGERLRHIRHPSLNIVAMAGPRMVGFAVMITIPLQSGSNGNCIYVEAGDTRLLFDAGITGKQAARRLAIFDRDIRRCQALIISHDHADHIRCAGVFHRKFGLPVYATEATWANVAERIEPISDVSLFSPGDVLRFGDVSVLTVPTPHDGADGVAFVVHHDGRQLGILTDLGHPFRRLSQLLAGLHATYLESNYDPEMLDTGPYPPELKARIRGPHGHLSNIEAARLIAEHAGSRLRWLALAHLSEFNNRPDLALATHREIVRASLPVHVASRYQAGPLLQV
jgi:phosphoribosyl 1,2-cyclic phosphodiesterase